MKVILIENIEKVGSKGDVVNVKRGFARNYLVPRNFALYATPKNMKKLEVLKKQFADDESKRVEHFKQIGEKITALHLTFLRKVDEHDSMYGSVSEMDILHELKEKNIDIPKTAIIMDKHLKQLGDFEVHIKLHKDVNVMLPVTVKKEAGKDDVAEEKPVEKKAKPKKAVEEVITDEVVSETVVEEVAAESVEETVTEEAMVEVTEAAEEVIVAEEKVEASVEEEVVVKATIETEPTAGDDVVEEKPEEVEEPLVAKDEVEEEITDKESV